MMINNADLLKNVMIASSGAAFVLSTFLATVVFDKVSPNSTLAHQEIEMGMAVQATDQHIEVFMDSVLLLQTSVDITNISTVDEDGNIEEGSIVDLFPVGGPATGQGTIIFKIKTITAEQMPDLSNKSHEMVPMAYVKQETFNEFAKSVIKLAAFGIKNVTYLAWLTILGSLGMMGLGGVLIFISKNQSAVRSVDDDDDD